jgi:putative transcription factor
MICEMCGNDSPATRAMMVESTRLMLCPNCAKFGDEYKASSGSGSAGAPSRAIIEQRLEKRERRQQTRDVYSQTETVEIVADFGAVIREAREAKGMDLEQFASSILEKKGTLAKVEANSLIPDDKLRAKIEKALGIKLTELVKSGGVVGGGNKSGAMTLGNFIRKE